MNKVRSLLFPMVFLPFASFANAQEFSGSLQQGLIEDKFRDEYVELDNLIVNQRNNMRTFARKSKEGGMVDLIDLSKTSKLEEAWAFIPEENLWIEIGKEERFDIEKKDMLAQDGRTIQANYSSANLALDNRYFFDLARNHDLIEVYHIHPRVSTGSFSNIEFGNITWSLRSCER